MKEKKPVSIQVTETFDKTLDNAISFLSQWSDEHDIIIKIEKLVGDFESQVARLPYSYSRCPELMDLGINAVRGANFHDFRILYQVNEFDDVINVDLLLFLRTKQSIEKQLIEYCLYQ